MLLFGGKGVSVAEAVTTKVHKTNILPSILATWTSMIHETKTSVEQVENVALTKRI